MPVASNIDPKWNRRYAEGDTPWDMGFPSRELVRLLDEGLVSGMTALELGCGTGTNSLFLASRGFLVRAVDGADLAIEMARQRAPSNGFKVNEYGTHDSVSKGAADQPFQIEYLVADVCALPYWGMTFDFLFDRGCFHCVRQSNLAGYLQSVVSATHEGSRFLLLTGNANEQREGGPPRIHEHELRSEFESLFTIDDLHPFRFDDPDGPTGPLGWSCLMTRRPV